MKLDLKKQRERGLWLLLLVFAIAVIVIGIIAYAIYKKITTTNWRPINPDDVAQWVQSATVELENNPQATVLSDGTLVQQLASTNEIPVIVIEMSTNLVDWFVRTNVPATAFNDFVAAEPMNLPQAFYRIRTP